jgi:hypothetical protein
MVVTKVGYDVTLTLTDILSPALNDVGQYIAVGSLKIYTFLKGCRYNVRVMYGTVVMVCR